MILLKNQTHNFWYNTRVFFEWKSIMERILKEKYFRALQSFFYITPFVNVISESISISLEYQYHHIIARNDFILFYFIYFYFSKAARHGLFDFFFFFTPSSSPLFSIIRTYQRVLSGTYWVRWTKRWAGKCTHKPTYFLI